MFNQLVESANNI